MTADLDDLESRLQHIAKLARFPKAGLRDLAKIVKKQTVRRFDSKRDPDGRAWSAWGKSYAASNPRGSLLQQSARLRRSMRIESTSGGVAVGTSTEYAAAHQFGTIFTHMGRPVVLPRREFMGVSSSDEAELQAALESFVDRFVGGRR